MNITDNSGAFKASKPGLSSKPTGSVSGSISGSVSAAASVSTSLAGSTASASQGGAAAQLMSTHADFDAAKVAEIRASISAGRYVVNTGRIADGLLASAQELLQSSPH